MDVIFFILSDYQPYTMYALPSRLTPSITEALGLITEIYLVATLCLPASSLLLHPSDLHSISPAEKLLLEIAFFQLFSFPLFSWGEIKPVFTSVLQSTCSREESHSVSSLPNSVACVFAVLYYIYDNSVLNVDPEGASLCDRNALPTGSSRLTEKLRLKAGAHAMGVKEEMLKKCVWCVWLTSSLITRMINKLGVIKTTRRNPAIVVGTSCSLHRSSTRPLPLAQTSDILRCPTTH